MKKKLLCVALCIAMLTTLVAPVAAEEVSQDELAASAVAEEVVSEEAVMTEEVEATEEVAATAASETPSAEVPELKIVVQPQSFVGPVGSKVVFYTEANRPDVVYKWMFSQDGGLTWRPSGMEGSDANSVTIDLIRFRDGQQYKCIVTDSAGNTVETVVADMVIGKELVIVQQPVDDFCVVGSKASFTVVADGDDLTYQWLYSQDGGKSWHVSTLTGCDTDTIIVDAKEYRFDCGQMYKCVITDARGNQVVTDAVTIREPSGFVLEVTEDPVDYVGVVNSTATFTVAAEGEGLTYQWMYSNNNGATWSKSSMDGCNTTILSVKATAIRAGQLYKCVITDTYGNKIESEAACLWISK